LRSVPASPKGLLARIEAAPLDLLAEVLAEIHGDAIRLLDGEPLLSRSSRRRCHSFALIVY
jgi:hypothetical protein